MTTLFLLSLLLVVCAGIVAWLWRRVFSRAASVVAGLLLTGCLLGLLPAIAVLASGKSLCLTENAALPVGSLSLQIDPLSAFFLLPIFLLSGMSAVYGRTYFRQHEAGRRLGPHWFLFSLFVVGMAMVVVARDAIIFLIAWEIMTVASFFLVTFDHERPSVRNAGLLYLALSHVGVACLFALFITLGGSAGNTAFSTFSFTGKSAVGAILFLLALTGFGLKAGVMPLHIWLPRAHPAAPSHISALMSGVMIKLGIYGIMRVLSFAQAPPFWWGATLIVLGAFSGILGIIYALMQHDLKKMLAYSSIENIGIITMGLGVGLLGRATGHTFVAALGFAGALLHVLNHALFKGLLFLGAGTIQHGAGTIHMEHLGGLLKKMRFSGAAFFTGALAICALPPLNGFVGEFLIYSACFQGGAHLVSAWGSAFLFAALTALAVIGGLAVACFTNGFGMIYLGEPRTPAAAHAHEVGRGMLYPMATLAGLCLLLGLTEPFLITTLIHPVAVITPGAHAGVVGALSASGALCRNIPGMALALLLLIGALALLRKRLLTGREIAFAGTWDCGYGTPTPRMQYTASSFAALTTGLFAKLFQPRISLHTREGYFPKPADLRTVCTDLFVARLYWPCFQLLHRSVNLLKVFQHGYTHLYILYILLILLGFMLWKVV